MTASIPSADPSPAPIQKSLSHFRTSLRGALFIAPILVLFACELNAFIAPGDIHDLLRGDNALGLALGEAMGAVAFAGACLFYAWCRIVGEGSLRSWSNLGVFLAISSGALLLFNNYRTSLELRAHGMNPHLHLRIVMPAPQR